MTQRNLNINQWMKTTATSTRLTSCLSAQITRTVWITLATKMKHSFHIHCWGRVFQKNVLYCLSKWILVKHWRRFTIILQISKNVNNINGNRLGVGGLEGLFGPFFMSTCFCKAKKWQGSDRWWADTDIEFCKWMQPTSHDLDLFCRIIMSSAKEMIILRS